MSESDTSKGSRFDALRKKALGPTELGRMMDRDRRSPGVTYAFAIRKIRADNPDLAEEIHDRLERVAGSSKDRAWVSAVEFVARFEPEGQRWAWEQVSERGVRWLKRYVEVQHNPPDSDALGDRLAAWIDREYPGLDHAVIRTALRDLAELLEAAEHLEA